jgi:hypothetical protein
MPIRHELEANTPATPGYLISGPQWDQQHVAVEDIGFRSSLTTNTDAVLARIAANELGLRNGSNPQRWFVYGTDDGAGNFERLFVDFGTSANAFRIGTDAGGTGSSKSLFISVNGSSRWSFTANSFLPLANTTYDIGSATSRVRDLFIGRDLNLGTGNVTANSISSSTGRILFTAGTTSPNIIVWNSVNFGNDNQGGWFSVNSRYSGVFPNWTKTSSHASNNAMFMRMSPTKWEIRMGDADNAQGTDPGSSVFNVTNTVIIPSKNVVPGAANTYDLGNTTNTWKNLHLGGSITLGAGTAAIRLIGRGEGAGTGALQEITLGTNLGMVGTAMFAVCNPAPQTSANTGTIHNLSLGNRYTYLRCTGAAPTITGISVFGGAPQGGDMVIVQNAGSGTVTLAHDDSGSSAANRLRNLGGAGISLDADEAATYVYDGTDTRWRLVSVLQA